MVSALLLAAPAGAQEEADLEASDPADGAELDSPPPRLTLTFSAPISDPSVAMTCDGDPYVEPDRGAPTLSADGRVVTVEFTTPMRAGRCNVSWRTLLPNGDDGPQGELSFFVRNSPTLGPDDTAPDGSVPTTGATTPVTAPAGADGSTDGVSTVRNAADVSDGATWLGRVLSTLGLAVLFGSFVLIVVAWPEGPEYILAVRFLRSVWILTFVGTVLFVVALSAAVNEESLGSGLSPSAWLDLLDAGWPGRAAIARLVLVVATGWVVLRPERVIDPTTQLPALAIPTLAVMTVGLARTGGDLAVLGVLAGFVHALAMAVWFGGVVLLARVVLAGPGEEDLVQAVQGFGRISGPAIALTVISGLVQLYRLDGADLFGEGHGRVLVLKTVFVAVMLFVGLTARQVAQQRLARAPDLTPPTADRLRRAFGTEAVIGLVVLGLSGWLMSFTPPKAPQEQQAGFAVVEPFVDATSGVNLEVSITPARVGANQLKVRVYEPQQDLAGLVVELIPPAGSGESIVSWPIPLAGAGVAISGPGDLPLPVAGVWTLRVSATTPQGAMAPTQQTFTVADAEGNVPTPQISPTPSQAPITSPTTTTTVAATATTAAG